MKENNLIEYIQNKYEDLGLVDREVILIFDFNKKAKLVKIEVSKKLSKDPLIASIFFEALEMILENRDKGRENFI